MSAPIYVLEGAWDEIHEAPQVLPYLNAYAQSYRNVEVYHRTFRCIDDIEFYVSRVPKGSRAFFYFACHGKQGCLLPSDGRSQIPIGAVENALRLAKEKHSIAFIHFGCCEFLHSDYRRQTLSGLLNAAGANWVSGYVREVGWLASMLLDLALISEVYVPWYKSDKKSFRIKPLTFFKYYEHLARSLGFSGIYSFLRRERLFPKRILTE